jgi:IS30 family transposase
VGRAFGGLPGRAASTIGRDLRRGGLEVLPAQLYCPKLAHAGYRARRKGCGRRRKLAPGGSLHGFVRGKLMHRRWSPEQIAR